MGKPTLGDIELILNDMLVHRREALHGSAAGRLYRPRLQALLDRIVALPEAAMDRPLAEELAAADARFDGYGRALHHLTTAYQSLPGGDPLAEAAGQVHTAFVPHLSVLTESYADEALTAHQAKAALVAREADLKRLPVAGGTAYDWACAFVEAGEQIAALLGERGDAKAEARLDNRKSAVRLLSNALGLLGRLRAALRDELDGDPRLDRALEGQVFGYFDEVSHQRKTHGAAAKVAAPAPATKASAEGQGLG